MATANDKSESAYIHGTEPQEQARLSLLNDLLNQRTVHELNLQGGERILDVGSGLGQLSRAMARLSGVPVVGVERSGEQIAEAVRQATEAGERSLERGPHFPREWTSCSGCAMALTRLAGVSS